MLSSFTSDVPEVFAGSMIWHRHLALLMLAGTLCAIPLAFPWFMINVPSIGAGIALFFSQLCHQNPSRSFALAGFTLPVCARCLALCMGGLVGIATYPLFRRRWHRGLKRSFLFSIGLLAIDVGLDVLGLWKNTFLSRSFTGVFCGGTAGLLLSLAIQDLTSQPLHSQMDRVAGRGVCSRG